jgi:hypothetical protein
LFSIFRKSPELLLDRSSVLVNFKSVLSQLPGDTRNVGWAPCEDVSVVPEEAGERKFLFGVEVGPDVDFLGCVGQAEELTVYFGAPSMFITLWFGFDYGTNPPLGTLII